MKKKKTSNTYTEEENEDQKAIPFLCALALKCRAPMGITASFKQANCLGIIVPGFLCVYILSIETLTLET